MAREMIDLTRARRMLPHWKTQQAEATYSPWPLGLTPPDGEPPVPAVGPGGLTRSDVTKLAWVVCGDKSRAGSLPVSGSRPASASCFLAYTEMCHSASATKAVGSNIGAQENHHEHHKRSSCLRCHGEALLEQLRPALTHGHGVTHCDQDSDRTGPS